MKTSVILISSLLVMSLYSCSDEEYNDRALLSEIVTVAENSQSSAEFRFQRYNDSPVIILTAKGINVNDDLIGKRVLLRYYPISGNATSSGEIEIAALSTINCDTTRVAAIDTIAWDETPIYLNSIWRSGEYINLHLRVIYSNQPRLFNITVDSSTIDNPVPQLYLCHNTFSAPDNYNFETYASYDISKIWSRPTCSGIEIHVNDTNLKKDIYSFTKK